MLVQHQDNLDIIPLTLSDDGAVATLTSSQLCYEGMYQFQLRGILLSDLTTKRHTNVIFVYISKTLIGDDTWGEIPTSFVEVERKILEINSHPPIPGTNGCWQLWDYTTHSYVESEFPLPDDGYVITIIDGGSASGE